MISSRKTAKILLAVILVGVLSAPLGTTSVHAQFGGPSFETNPALTLSLPEIATLSTTISGATAISATENVAQTLILQTLNGLAWTVAKTAVQSITKSMVNWINNGFQGSPAFVTDLNENLGQLSDAVAYDFFNHLDQLSESQTGFNLRSPFQDQISQRIREEYYLTSSSYGFDDKYSYTLGDVSDDPQAFYNGNFSHGGFNAWLSTSQRPQNNPFGAYLLATNELSNQIQNATEKRKVELGWGNGFLSWRGNCNSTATAEGSKDLGFGLTANQLADSTTKSLGNAVAEGSNLPGAAPVSLSQKDDCLGHRIQTPGAVVETQLEGVLGSGVRQLELADSINEIVGALLGQMVNQVAGGVGLSGLSQPTYGGGSSYINQVSGANQYSNSVSSLASGFRQTVDTTRRNVTTYRSNWQTILNAANAAKASCSSNSGSTQIDSVIYQSNAAIVRAGEALTALNDVSTKINTASGISGGNQVNAVASAAADYQSLLSSNTLPSAEEMAEAQTESQDSSGTQTSLYTQMRNASRSCGGA